VRKSDIEIKVDGNRPGYIQRLLRDLGPHDYIKPAWGTAARAVSAAARATWGAPEGDLFVWCDECLQWNCHGLCDGEVEGYITARCPHCPCKSGEVMYCMGMADAELAKVLQRYSTSTRAKHTPPPVRRVYPVNDERAMESPK